ncbi:MAG: hypothetical protein EOO25_21940, partial [Comamonadaceae bacterium]
MLVSIDPEVNTASPPSRQQLWNRLADATADPAATGAEHFNATWLALQCTQIPGAQQAVLVLGPPDTGPFLPVAFWPTGRAATPLLAEVADNALQARQPSVQQQDGLAAIAYPVMLGGHLHGLVALESAARADGAVQDAIRQLQWGVQGIEAALLRQDAQREQATRERLMATL